MTPRRKCNALSFQLHLIAFILVCLGACVTTDPSSSPALDAAIPEAEPLPTNSYYAFVQAHTAYRDGRLDLAEDHLKRAVELDPKSRYLKMELATLYLKREFTDKALRVLEDLLAVDPNHESALFLYGRIHEQKENRAEAKAAYEKIVSLDSSNESAYLLLGNIYMDEERWEDALRIYQQLVDRIPGSYAGHFFIGKIHLQQERLTAARASFEKALMLEPALEEARFELLNIYHASGEDDRIIQTYQQLLDQNPDNVRALMGLGYAYHMTGFTEESERVLKDLGRKSAEDVEVIRTLIRHYIDPEKYDQALVILEGMRKGSPDHSDLHYLTGVALDAKGEKAAAVAHFKKVQSGSRFFENAALHTAVLLQELGNLQKAIEYMQDAVNANPDKPEFRLYLGSFYEETGQYAAAEQSLKAGLNLDPDNVRLLFRLGVVYDKWGKKQDSISQMRTVIKLDPENANALNYLGYTFAEMGENLDEAERLIKQALEYKPDDGYITDSLGWVYFKKGMLDKALLYLEKAVNLTPDDPIIAEHLADAYREAGDLENALKYYLRSLENNNENPAAVQQKIEQLQQNAPLVED